MKKYIISVILLATCVSIFKSADLYAQSSNAVDTMYMTKSAQFDYETQSGVITLENYVPGEMKISQEAKAVDIVLVLDFSGSMVGTSGAYTPDTSSGEPKNFDLFKTSARYCYSTLPSSCTYNGTSYTINKVQVGSAMWAYIEVSGKRYYLTPEGGFKQSTSTSNPSSATDYPLTPDGRRIFPVTSSDATIFSQYTITNTTIDHRIDALQCSVYRFIDKIREHQVKTGKKDRIAIIQFQGPSTPPGMSDYSSSSSVNYLREYCLDTKRYPTYKTEASSTTAFGGTSVMKDFTELASNQDVITLKRSMSDLMPPMGATSSNKGMEYAKLMLDSYARTDSDVAKYVILFTDGKPEEKGGCMHWTDETTGYWKWTANATIAAANPIKQDDVLIYTLYCNSKDPDSNSDKYMDYTSSNYKNATSMTASPGTAADPKKYYAKAKQDLNKVFDALTEDIIITTTGKYDVQTTLNDFINNEYFKLPEGATKDDIYVIENKCTGYDSSTKIYSWADTTDHTKTRRLTEADGISITITPGDTTKPKTDPGYNDRIEISGYDYSKNWCGMDISKSPNVPHGARLIVMIPFVYKTTQVWGDLPTNSNKSGVTVVDSTGQTVEDKKYPVPTLPFCYISLTRHGLHKGESAIFVIEKPNSSGGWDFVDKVVINGNGSGLDYCTLYGVPGETFKVTETNWNWAYHKTINPQVDSLNKSVEPYEVAFVFTGDHKVPTGEVHEQEKDPANLHNHDEAFKVNHMSIPPSPKPDAIEPKRTPLLPCPYLIEE